MTKHVFIRQRKWNSYVICMRAIQGGIPRGAAFCKVVSSVRNFKKHLLWWVMVNQAKKGKVIQMSNLPLKHGKGGLA
ncbi:hypothetical protein OCO53_15365 [Peribacillus frigoritolerans]|uniref:hypothetical protein n=1 Tax=Peribacillus frigoritolerans TaxID=450367 RepID=UPI0021D13151|nr:hypothetical protein [Peribacillus frigoritolerans]MCU6601851.1 hypothetical protein [Peribacillus frigoritolerans]